MFQLLLIWNIVGIRNDIGNADGMDITFISIRLPMLTRLSEIFLILVDSFLVFLLRIFPNASQIICWRIWCSLKSIFSNLLEMTDSICTIIINGSLDLLLITWGDDADDTPFP